MSNTKNRWLIMKEIWAIFPVLFFDFIQTFSWRFCIHGYWGNGGNAAVTQATTYDWTTLLPFSQSLCLFYDYTLVSICCPPARLIRSTMKKAHWWFFFLSVVCAIFQVRHCINFTSNLIVWRPDVYGFVVFQLALCWFNKVDCVLLSVYPHNAE